MTERIHTLFEGDGDADWHTLETENVQIRLETGVRGLTAAEAARRLDLYGPNELEDEPPPTALEVFARQFASPLPISGYSQPQAAIRRLPSMTRCTATIRADTPPSEAP